jgi:hypothetical protein
MDLNFLLICMGFGIVGQSIRALIGIYKLLLDKTINFKSEFSWVRFGVSLLIGASTGILTFLIYNSNFSKSDLLGMLSAGYAGTDWIEGVMTKQISVL